MSGGSFDYLYCKEPEELFNRVEYIEDMSEIALKLGYRDIALDLTRLAEYIKSAKIRVTVLQEQLKEVMRSIEWYESADIGEDTLKERFEEYRQGADMRGEEDANT